MSKTDRIPLPFKGYVATLNLEIDGVARYPSISDTHLSVYRHGDYKLKENTVFLSGTLDIEADTELVVAATDEYDDRWVGDMCVAEVTSLRIHGQGITTLPGVVVRWYRLKDGEYREASTQLWELLKSE